MTERIKPGPKPKERKNVVFNASIPPDEFEAILKKHSPASIQDILRMLVNEDLKKQK